MLYKLNTEKIELSSRMRTKSPAQFQVFEKDIENFLKSRLNEVVSEDQLMLIGQERSWQEEPDLLALDEKGQLYIFELKRCESDRANILQLMRYAQKFGRYTYLELQDLARRQQKLDGDLKEKHKGFFELNEVLKESEFNKEQILVLVTNGTNQDTISAINFWSKKGVKIECSPYRMYDIGGDPYIQFDTYSPDAEVIPEVNTQYFIANTNKTWMPKVWKEMLQECKAAAYYGRKFAVCSISKGSVVYLYHTGVGVIAKGVAKSDFLEKDFDGEENAEYYVPLSMEWSLQDEKQWPARAPAAWEINKKLNAGHRFRKTVFSISQEMAEIIDVIANQRGVPEA